MKRLGRLLAAVAVMLGACTDRTPSGPNTDIGTTPLLAPPNPCTDCVYGPARFVRRAGDGKTVTFAATPGDYTFNIEDDGDPATTARVILNGTAIVAHSGLAGPGGPLAFSVTLLDNNTMTVAVRGGREHWVTIWIAGTITPPVDPIDVQPDVSERLPGGTQQFAVVIGAPGPYTWSVHGTDGGDATFGTIDGNGFYTAPGAVPTPATFDVCARVTADPTNSDCSPMTISPIPTAGEDVVVYNDINVFTDGSMANPNNILMLGNLLGYTSSGPRAGGTVVLLDGGHGPICGFPLCAGTFYTFTAQIAALGFTLTLDTSGDLSTIASNVKVLVLYLPTVFYTVPEINAMKVFAAEGGRIIFIGEHANFYGGGFPAQNDFLTKMGAQMTNVGDFIDCGQNTLPFASLRAHQVTTGMTDVSMACSSQILLGPNDFALYYDLSNTKILSGVAKISTLPLPAPIVPMGRVSGIPKGWKPTADAMGNPLN